jgi:hypothetical protein
MKRRAPVWLISLALITVIVFVAATCVLVGILHTPYNATDSVGRKIGFIDPLSSEHYEIIVGNFRPRDLLHFDYIVHWGYFAAQIVALVLLGTKIFWRKTVKIFFAMQLLFLPVGLLGALVLIDVVFSIPAGTVDRETFVDIPAFNVLVSAPLWMATSVGALIVLMRRKVVGGVARSGVGGSEQVMRS